MSSVQMFIEIIKTLPIVLIIYAFTAIFSFPLGILLAVYYSRKGRIIKTILSLYAWLFRGTPLMLQLLVVYYGLPMINIFGYRIVMGPYTAGIITFIINYAAYIMEIIRGGIESIDKGQYEASKVLGYNNFQTMRYIILPPAIRRVLPTLGNEAIALIKDTSLIYVLAVTEIMKRTKELANTYYNITPYICSFIIYLALSFCVDSIFKSLEKKNKVRL